MKTLGILLSIICYSYASSQEALPVQTPAPQQPEIAQPAPIPSPVPQPPPVKKERKIEVAAGFMIISDGVTTFDEAKVATTTGTYNGEIELKSESAAGLLIEGRIMKQHSAGAQFGLVLEGQREITEVTAKIGNTTVNGTFVDPKPKINYQLLYANATYKWENFYLLGGFNYSFPTIETKTAEPGSSLEVEGALGAQLGLGYQFTKLFGMEFVSQATGIRVKERTSTYNADWGVGYMSDARLIFKFAF